MTPLQIEMLLHYYYSPEPWSGCPEPLRSETFLEFVHRGYLEMSTRTGPRGDTEMAYTLTPKGKVYVEALLNVPEPVWMVPTIEDVRIHHAPCNQADHRRDTIKVGTD